MCCHVQFYNEGIPLAIAGAINREFIKHSDTLFKQKMDATDIVAISLAIKNMATNARKYSISREPELMTFISAGYKGLFATHPNLESRMQTFNS